MYQKMRNNKIKLCHFHGLYDFMISKMVDDGDGGGIVVQVVHEMEEW